MFFYFPILAPKAVCISQRCAARGAAAARVARRAQAGAARRDACDRRAQGRRGAPRPRLRPGGEPPPRRRRRRWHAWHQRGARPARALLVSVVGCAAPAAASSTAPPLLSPLLLLNCAKSAHLHQRRTPAGARNDLATPLFSKGREILGSVGRYFMYVCTSY